MEKYMEVIQNNTVDVLNAEDFLNCSSKGLHKVTVCLKWISTRRAWNFNIWRIC